jgi:hypothetical protein
MVETSPSCHVQSHAGQDEIVQTADAKTSIDEGCTCFVNMPSPYVLAKSGKKKIADQDRAAEIPAGVTYYEAVSETVESQPLPIVINSSSYLFRLSVSKPSRAPPRL